MHARVFVISGAIAVFAAAGLSLVGAQQRPDLSGTWVVTKDAAPVIAAIFGDRIAFKHTGQALTIFRPGRGPTDFFVTSHRLDGADTRVMLPGNTCFGQSGQIVTTTWDGSAIAYTITGSLSPGNTTPRPVSLNTGSSSRRRTRS